jgi:antitoxin MazE
MKTRIQKWGNSLAVRIPKSYAEDLGLADNSPAEMSLEEGGVVIRPDKERSWDLDSLLTAMTDENVHPAWDSEEGLSAEAGKTNNGEDK